MRPSLRPGEDIVLRTLCKVSESELTGTGGAVLCNGRVQLFCASPLLQETTTLYVVAAPPRLRQTEPATERNGNREFRRNRCAIGALAMRVYSYFSFMYPPFYYPHPHQKVLGPSGQLLAPYIGAGPLRTPSRGRTDYTYTVYTPIFALT